MVLRRLAELKRGLLSNVLRLLGRRFEKHEPRGSTVFVLAPLPCYRTDGLL